MIRLCERFQRGGLDEPASFSSCLMIPRRYRKVFLSLVLGTGLAVIFYLTLSYETAEQRFFAENYLAVGHARSVQLDDVCHLPIDISPFDPSLAEFLEKRPNRVECSDNDFHSLTFVDESGTLRQNFTSYKCHYTLMSKSPLDDDNIDYGRKIELDPQNGLVLSEVENYVFVECCCHEGRNYQNVHFWFNPKPQRDSTQNNANPNVLILVIESLSRLNYLRYLNQTRQILERELGNIHYLEGLNKLADNSLPNMAPLLTGRRLYNNELDVENVGPYDHWPLIWKNFSRNGYQTALVEDYPIFTLFNYQSKGFIKSPPTNFYPRPYWIQVFKSFMPLMLKLFPFQISHCFNNRVPKVDLFLNQVNHFVRQCAKVRLPYFAFTFYIEITHNDFNNAQIIDYHIAQFLRQTRPHIDNNTVVIIMGDHGNRFGAFLQTTIGRIEERMPLFAMHLPPELSAKYPYLSKMLEKNQKRLTTWLDVHEMLVDITENRWKLKTQEETESNPGRAYSPWREEIPRERSCQEALVPSLYCACDSRVPLELNQTVAQKAAEALVAYINQLLESLPLCHTLTLNRTLSAELIFPSGGTAQAAGYRQQVEVTVRVAPSDGLFRSRLYRTAHQPEWSVEGGQVTRINAYGNQSQCITRRDLKPFCLCPLDTRH